METGILEIEVLSTIERILWTVPSAKYTFYSLFFFPHNNPFILPNFLTLLGFVGAIRDLGFRLCVEVAKW